MIELYRTEKDVAHGKLKVLLPAECEIKRTENGKPYTDSVCFSLTHTGDTALIAISDKPVGIDAEIIRKRNFSSLLKRFSAREQTEIKSTADFLRHWVIKEAYIKLIGGTLAHYLKNLEYFGGELLVDGVKADCNILLASSGDLIYCVCAESEIPKNLKLKTI